MSTVVKMTIQCDAVILRCTLVPEHVCGGTPGGDDRPCPECGSRMHEVAHCQAGFALTRGELMIRCIAENKEGWRCEEDGRGDYCPAHAHLADHRRIEQPTPQAVADL